MTTLASNVAQLQAASVSQSIGIAVARQGIDAQRAVASLVAGTAAAASPPPPPGQGKVVDLKV